MGSLKMKINLYGVMGSIHGGDSDLGKNTTCLVLSHNKQDLILDSGTGILKYMNEIKKEHYHILFSHYHADHILGFPFIPQLFDASNTINIYGPNFNNKTVKNELFDFIKEPYFPIKTSHILSKLNSKTVLEGETQIINGFEVQALMVDHPGGNFIYSIKVDNKKICFLTDLPNGMEHCKDVINFCANSDLIYADAMFLETELLHNGYSEFGHSCVESVIRFFEKTESKKLLLGHHKSFRNYSDLVKHETKNVIISKENSVIEI